MSEPNPVTPASDDEVRAIAKAATALELRDVLSLIACIDALKAENARLIGDETGCRCCEVCHHPESALRAEVESLRKHRCAVGAEFGANDDE